MRNIYQWFIVHPAAVSALTLGLYHVASAAVDSLVMPNQASSSLYRFFFAFANRLAANYWRASAAKDTLPLLPKQ
jgi:hypothetical protein